MSVFLLIPLFLFACRVSLRAVHVYIMAPPQLFIVSSDPAPRRCSTPIVPAMDEVRRHADLLERLVDDSTWPLPKYREMLFLH